MAFRRVADSLFRLTDAGRPGARRSCDARRSLLAPNGCLRCFSTRALFLAFVLTCHRLLLSSDSYLFRDANHMREKHDRPAPELSRRTREHGLPPSPGYDLQARLLLSTS